MTSSTKEFEQDILAAISEDTDLLRRLEAVPGMIEKTVEELTPVLTGETKKSIEVKSRKSELKKLSTRRVKLGTVYSDDDPVRVASIEFGRGDGEVHGGTPAYKMFTRAAIQWMDVEI